jgi:diguanylate cyclase (GGDEF)-like protein
VVTQQRTLQFEDVVPTTCLPQGSGRHRISFMQALVKRLRPRSFRAQLATCFALLTSLLAVGLAAVLGVQLSHQVRGEEGAMLQSMARVTARQLSDGMLQRAREVRAMAESSTLWTDGLDTERVLQALNRSQAVNPHSAWIGVADAQGRVRTATGHMLEGADVSQRPWFGAGSRGLYVGDVHPAKLLANLLPQGSDGGPQRFVDFAAPIRQNGQLLGVLAIHGSWDWAHQTIAALLPSAADERGLQVFVFDRDGRIIYAPGGLLPALAASGQRLPLSPAGHEPAVVLAWQDGQPYLTAAVALPSTGEVTDLGWTVVVREPEYLAFAPARHAVHWALSLGALLALASACLGWWMTRRLTESLKRLALLAQAVDAESRTVELPLLFGNIEVERLSRAMIGMTQRLREANTVLEQRVQSRTAALERANAELAQLAQHDPLTGVLNRRGLDQRATLTAASAKRSGAPVSVLVFDADHFKRINDVHGHDVGDEVLRHLSQTLGSRLREVDILARTGGEEFAALLPDTDSSGACRVAAAMVALVAARPLRSVGQITISCGVTEWQVDREPLREALARADAALYAAKQAGRNGYQLQDAPPLTQPAALQAT